MAVMRYKLPDGTWAEVPALVGQKGEKGDPGYTPVKGVDYFDGKDGEDGADGSAGKDGVDGVSPTVSVSKSGKVTTVSITDKNGTKTATINDGADGAAGAKGDKGDTGATGYSPVRGTDYWTEADKSDIVREVLASMATPVAGIVDENNNIIITADLPDGTYAMRYEYADGTKSDIVTIVINSGPAYTNLADPTSDDWLTNKRINSSKNIVDVTEAQRGDKTVVVTNKISLAGISKLHIKGLDIINSLSSGQNYGRMYLYKNGVITQVTYQPSVGVNGKTHYTVADYDSSVTILDVATAIKDWGYTGLTEVSLGGVLTGAASDVIITADEPIQ